MNNKNSGQSRSGKLHLWIAVLLTLIGWEIYMGYRYDQLKEDLLSSTEMFTIASHNPVLRWEYRAKVQVYDPETHIDVRTNNYGFRDRDFLTERSLPGRRRIALVGDSVTFGLKENIEHTFSRKFEKYANAQAGWHAVETLNFGVDGYNTLQVNELLKEVVMQFKPDEVIYIMCVNDFNFDSLEGDMQIFFEKPWSFILQALQRLFMRITPEDIHIIDFDKNKDRVFSLIGDMHERLTSQNIDFTVVLVPAFYHGDTSFDDYPLVRMHQETATVLTGIGIKVVDLLPSFSNSHMPPGHFAHDIWHLNKAGHERVAFELGRLQ